MQHACWLTLFKLTSTFSFIAVPSPWGQFHIDFLLRASNWFQEQCCLVCNISAHCIFLHFILIIMSRAWRGILGPKFGMANFPTVRWGCGRRPRCTNTQLSVCRPGNRVDWPFGNLPYGHHDPWHFCSQHITRSSRSSQLFQFYHALKWQEMLLYFIPSETLLPYFFNLLEQKLFFSPELMIILIYSHYVRSSRLQNATHGHTMTATSWRQLWLSGCHAENN